MKDIRKKLSLTVLFLLLFSQFIFSQNTDKLHFKNISTQAGLSNKMVLCIAQDTTGFMWIGTAEGLNRYDGYEFKVFRHIPGDAGSLSASWVNCLLITKSGELWAGTEKGISIYNPVNETFHSCKVSNDSTNLLGNLRIRSLYEDSKGIIWIGTLEGLIKLDRKNDYIGYFAFVADKSKRMANEIRDIFEAENNQLWVATFDGLYRLNMTDNSFERFEARYTLPNDQKNNLVSDICAVKSKPGVLFIATSNGLVAINEFDGKIIESYRKENSAIADNDVKSVTVYDDSRLILATANGISLFNIENKQFETYNSFILDSTSLPNETVWCVKEDKLGSIWLGTNNGVALLDRKRKPIHVFRTVTNENGLIKHLSVNDILIASDQTIWLTSNDGIMRYDKDMRLLKKYKGKENGISHPIVKRIMADSRGIIWIGTNDGINYYDPVTDKFRTPDYEANNIPLKYIYDVKEDKDGDIVVNVSSGICFITPQYTSDSRIKSFKYRTAMIDEIITSVNSDVTYFDIDKRGVVWIGTINEGLFSYDKTKDKFTQYEFDAHNPNSINSNRIYSIRVDADGAVWIGTDMGLCRFDISKESFTRFSDDADLSGSIRTITSDTQSRLWISTEDKLVMFDYEYNHKIIINLFDDVGIAELVFNSFFNDPDGTIYMGGNGGFITFQPQEMVLNMDKAPIVLTNFEFWGKSGIKQGGYNPRLNEKHSISFAQKKELDYNENSFKISFAMLNFSSSANNKYVYMLKGYDENSLTAETGDNFVYYSNLPPGNYTFWVKGINSDGIWTDQAATLDITIKAPWWRTWWAYFMYISAIGILIYFAYRITANRLRLNAELSMEKLERNRIEELNQIKLKFFTNISHEFKTPLSLILGPIESLKENMKGEKQQSQLNIMKQNAERLLRLINQIMDMRKVENEKMTLVLKRGEFISFSKKISESFSDYANRRNISYRFNSSVEFKDMFFDSDKIEKILYNLISNAMKYTPDGGSIDVIVNEKDNDLIVSVCDSGIGISPDDQKHLFDRFYQSTNQSFDKTYGTGVGLALTKEFVMLHGGEITIHSQLGEGSTFEFTIPTDLSSIDIQDDSLVEDIEDDIEFSDHFTKYKVLIIEDNDDMLQFLRMNLEDYYEIYTTNNGEEGLQMVNEKGPDLVISDIMMPGIDGFEVCSAIKDNIITSHIPVILLTAKNDEMSRSEGYSRGADSYIYKPFSIKTLRVRIDKMIEQRERIQQNYRQKVLSEPSEIVIESENDRFINTLMKLIEANMEDPDFGIKELCEKSEYSYQQIYRKTKALTGETINEFIRRVRLKRAMQYLTHSDLRVSEIMYKVGFNSHSYFTKCFREYYGLSPKDYVQKMKE